MAKTRKEELYSAHLNDLSSWGFPNANAFICPICGNTYDNLTQLSLGHVWPKLLRKKVPGLNDCCVLLCEYCNQTAGSRGDAQMQVAEKIAYAEAAGEFLDERKVKLIEDGKEPITLKALVSGVGGTEGRITFNARRNNPVNVAAFAELAKSKKHFNMQISPHPLLDPGIAFAGWVTSAFLLAFYTFGYRYVISGYLDPVRDYIWESFSGTPKQVPDGVNVRRYRDKGLFNPVPRIEVNIPLRPLGPIHLQVKFQRNIVTLPFHFDPTSLGSLLQVRAPNIFDKGTGQIKANLPENSFLAINVECTKTRPHSCVWDYVLVKEYKVKQ